MDKIKNDVPVIFKTALKRLHSGDYFSVAKKIDIKNDNEDISEKKSQKDNKKIVADKLTKQNQIDDGNDDDNNNNDYNDEELITCSVCGNIWDGYAQCYPCNLEDVE